MVRLVRTILRNVRSGRYFSYAVVSITARASARIPSGEKDPLTQGYAPRSYNGTMPVGIASSLCALRVFDKPTK